MKGRGLIWFCMKSAVMICKVLAVRCATFAKCFLHQFVFSIAKMLGLKRFVRLNMDAENRGCQRVQDLIWYTNFN